jgi:putative PIN family toxin of toxin-antitoxin system
VTLVVVLDVNILASAAVSEFGLPRVVLRAGLRRQFHLVISEHILKKLVDTFEKPYFVARLLAADRNDFVDLVVKRSRSREPDESVRGVAPDLEDDLILGTAVAAHADFLVTGDKGLLAIGEYRGVRIVTAGQFLAETDFA